VQAVLRGMKPCVIGIVLATGVYMILKNMIIFSNGSSTVVDGKAMIITAALFGSMFAYKKLNKKKLSPILLIIISAILGVLLY